MANREDRPQVPKPYDFVPIMPLDSRDREMPRGHDKYYEGTVSGRLDAVIVVITPLHVSTGQMRLRIGRKPPLVKAMTRVNDRPCIPSSTLKGIVRSVTEAITRSCVRITQVRSYKLPDGVTACEDKDNLCLACRMFGALGFEGHVRFSDAVALKKQVKIARMPALYQPRQKTRAYFEKDKVKGRKFYKHGRTIVNSRTPVETLPPKSQLKFNVQFENLSTGELGVLLTALGLGSPPLTLKLGGGKPACYGSFIVVERELQVWDTATDLYATYDVTRRAVKSELYLQAAQPILLAEQLNTLAEIWTYDPQRRCPEGNY